MSKFTAMKKDNIDYEVTRGDERVFKRLEAEIDEINAILANILIFKVKISQSVNLYW